jgi:hypothetical protein
MSNVVEQNSEAVIFLVIVDFSIKIHQLVKHITVNSFYIQSLDRSTFLSSYVALSSIRRHRVNETASIFSNLSIYDFNISDYIICESTLENITYGN